MGCWRQVRLSVDLEVEVEAVGGRPVAGRVDALLLEWRLFVRLAAGSSQHVAWRELVALEQSQQDFEEIL